MKNQALFSSKDKSEKSKCRLLQFLFGTLRVNGSFRQYFSLYRAISQSKGEGRDDMQETKYHNNPTCFTASTVGPCPTIVQISRMPQL